MNGIRIFFVSLLASFVFTVALHATPGTGKLQVYFIDVEGGQSTLFVTPTGESLLIDTGWPDHDFRDADRIVAAAKRAGLTRIDYVLITHFHNDHVGGVPQLAQRIPIGTFLDHGPNRELDKGVTEQGYAAYQAVLAQGKSKHIVLKPGDRLPIPDFDGTVISADGKLIEHALPGAGQPNSYCQQTETRPADQTENARSLGVLLRFGKLASARPGRPDLGQGTRVDVPGEQAGRGRCVGGVAPWLVSELEPRAGRCYPSARGHYG